MKAPAADIAGTSDSGPTSRSGIPSRENALVHLASLAARILRAPVAMITGPALPDPVIASSMGRAIGAEKLWSSANALTICRYISATDRPLLLGDLGISNENTADAPTERPALRARAYAGVPVRSAAASLPGALCVIDDQARSWTPDEIELLRQIAAILEAIPPFSGDPRQEIQVRQSLKLEAVGRLAGGIAHDFNNLLTAIRGHADLLLDDIAADDPMRLDLEQIRRSTDRAALLTRQLLAFGRKQIMQPRTLDLASLLPVWTERLRPELGDGVSLQLDVAPGLTRIKGDPDHLESALRCVVQNADEALPMGGSIAIAAANATIDEAFARRFPYRVQPGEYVQITVADNGRGMDEKTLERIFEPFFTTREPPQGAGLGLSTVYGIVKQSGGYVWAESTVGVGTTIRLYLPGHTG